MVLRIEIPEDISRLLSEHWGDMPKHVLESLAVEGYRSGVLTEYQVGRMLALDTRDQVAEFLKQHRVFPDYAAAEMARALDSARRAAEIHDRETNASRR